MTAPCKGCQYRYSECHATCPKYARFAAERRQEYRKNAMNADIDAHIAQRCLEVEKKKHHQKGR